MVDFDTTPAGPCNDILEGAWEDILNIIELTEETGSEHALMIVEDNGEFKSGHPIEGYPEAITPAMKTEVKNQAFQTIHDMGVSIHDVKMHFIHTHPKGHTSHSIGDIAAIPFDQDSETPPDSHLIAVDNGDGEIMLEGLFKERNISEDNLEKLKTAARGISKMVDSGMRPIKGKINLLERYDVWFSSCFSTREVE